SVHRDPSPSVFPGGPPRAAGGDAARRRRGGGGGRRGRHHTGRARGGRRPRGGGGGGGEPATTQMGRMGAEDSSRGSGRDREIKWSSPPNQDVRMPSPYVQVPPKD